MKQLTLMFRRKLILLLFFSVKKKKNKKKKRVSFSEKNSVQEFDGIVYLIRDLIHLSSHPRTYLVT